MRRVGLLTLVVFALSGTAAQAATVERVQRNDPFGVPYESFYVVYTAAPGEANDLEIRFGVDGVTFHEAQHAVAPKGCVQVDPTTARCESGEPIIVELGDGDDVARVVETRPPSPEPRSGVEITAGPGADTVTGGPDPDIFTDGGAGEADRFAGGGGTDRLTYTGRAQPIRITVGAPGEDALESIETLQGGDADDVIIGNGAANTLSGGDGDDVIRGLGGRDVLDGEGGSDRLFGGAGRDELSGDDIASEVGRDLLDGGTGDDFLDLSAADDEQLSVGGPTFDPQPDFRRDTARGGSGFDAVQYAERRDRLSSIDAEQYGDGFLLARRLERISRTRVRLRVGVVPGPFSPDDTRIWLTPRGKSRPRLTRPFRISEDRRSARLRLTAAGVRHLRRHRAVTLRGPDPEFDGTLAVRVTR